MIGQNLIGKRVLVRAGSAGVHYGNLEEREGPEVLLSNARRIWSWNGALSLSEIAPEQLKKKMDQLRSKQSKIWKEIESL